MPDDKHPIEEALSSISVKSLIEGFRAYRETFRMVFRHPGDFLAAMKEKDAESVSLKNAFATYLYGVALSFVIYAPIIVINDVTLDKMHFMLQFVYLQALAILLLHLSVKLFLGRGTLIDTATAYFFYVGVVSPIVLLLSYPLYLNMAVSDFVNIGTQTGVSGIPRWVQVWNGVVFLALLIFGFITILRWLAQAHGVSRLRIIAAIAIVFMPVMMAHNVYVAPHVGRVVDVAAKVIDKID